jgi:DNA-binding response OmpR family regulator
MANIILATPDTLIYDVFSAEIAAAGHQVYWASNGQEAYELALAHAADAVLLDAQLPVFNAFETCEMLRDDPDIPAQLPILLLTDEDIDPHKLERAHLTMAFPKTHLAQALNETLGALLGPKAGI